MESASLVNQRMVVKKAARAVQIPEDVIQNYMEHPVADEEVDLTRILATALVTLSDRADALMQKVTKMESYAKHMKIILHASLLASKELIPDVPSVSLEGDDVDIAFLHNDNDNDDGDGESNRRPKSGIFGFPKHLLMAPRRGSEKRKSERRGSTDSTPTVFFENPPQPFALVVNAGGGGAKAKEAGSTSELQRLLLDKNVDNKRNSSSTSSSGGGDRNGEDDDDSPRQDEAMATFEF
eukprot:m.96068 g.96068  ORF g.96068 m.96068 type:complete len:238 (-) comp26863_c0_seq1:145-858(-)